MKPKVIHIRESRKTADEVYIGRAGKGHDGYFGNPVAIGRQCPVCGELHNDNGSTLPCYKRHLEMRLSNEAGFMERVMELKGKTLVCFCKPKPCHGDILSDMVMYLLTTK